MILWLKGEEDGEVESEPTGRRASRRDERREGLAAVTKLTVDAILAEGARPVIAL